MVTDDEDELVGLIAYALYKQTKRDWIIRHKDEHDHPPFEDEEKLFEKTHTDQALERLRYQAKAKLMAYFDLLVENEIPEIREEAINSHALKQAKETLQVVEAQNVWWRQILMGVTGAFAFSIILAAIGFILRINGSDLLKLLLG